jgi:hypothetical protein
MVEASDVGLRVIVEKKGEVSATLTTVCGAGVPLHAHHDCPVGLHQHYSASNESNRQS